MDFKSILDKLKLSSRDAIINGEKDSLGSLKRYLHIERRVEEDLSELVGTCYKADAAQLILVIGNVGDGKSHLLARMREKHPLEMTAIQVHNDATESLSRHKSYLDTLAEVLGPFSDAALPAPGNHAKTMVAINLGTLTNFLDERGDGFGQLKDFVADNRILQDDERVMLPQAHPHFKFINLADYHLYALQETGPVSQVLSDIVSRITERTQRNPFYQAYERFYAQHPDPESCPIKYNFDLLGQQAVQQRVVQLLIEAMVKYKLIVSVRLAMNFFYDLLVPPVFFGLSGKEVITRVSARRSGDAFYNQTLPWLLFDSSNTSAVLRYLRKLDPVNASNETLDHLIIEMGTTADPGSYFIRHGLLLPEDRLYSVLSDVPVLDRIKLFIRLNYILGVGPAFFSEDRHYQAFMQHLYNFHAGQVSRLITLYRNVQKAIFEWNGAVRLEDGYLNLDIGRQQSNYRLSQKVRLDLAPLGNREAREGTVERFSNSIVLGFKLNGGEETFQVKLDYGLYRLLMGINEGYRANPIDKSNHVDFKQFVHRLSSHQAQEKEVLIHEFHGERQRRFKLSFTPGFDVFQFEEIL